MSQIIKHQGKCPDCNAPVELKFLGPPTLTDGLYASTIMIEHPLMATCPLCDCVMAVRIETVNFIVAAQKIITKEPPRIIVPGRPV